MRAQPLGGSPDGTGEATDLFLKLPRNALLAVGLPAVACSLALIRWKLQGQENIFSDVDKSFYIPDPDLLWRYVDTSVFWVGLDLIILFALLGLGTLGAALLLRFLEKKRKFEVRWAHRLLWSLAAVPLVIPCWAFLSGFGPSNARLTLPQQGTTIVAAEIKGSLPSLPPGEYAVQTAHSSLIAKLHAGGDIFDARFTGINGAWRLDPQDFTQFNAAEINVRTDTIDTGIALRSKHSREFLKTQTYEKISFRLTQLTGIQQKTEHDVFISATGQLSIMGEEQEVVATGTLKALDAKGIQRLSLRGPSFLLFTTFEVDLNKTPLRSEKESFDKMVRPLQGTILFERIPKLPSTDKKKE